MSSSFRRAARPRPISSSLTKTKSKVTPSPSAQASSPSLVLERRGTKPWIGGLTLTSSGLREWDAILGGGQPLGTAILLQEDRWTQDLALALTRCWSAEAVSQTQILGLVATKPSFQPSHLDDLDNSSNCIQLDACGMTVQDCNAFVSLLPKDLHLEKVQAKAKKLENPPRPSTSLPEKEQASAAIAERQPIGIIEEEEGSDFEEEDPQDMGRKDTKDPEEEGLKNAFQYRLSIQNQRLGKTSQLSQPLSSQGEKVYCHSYDLSARMMNQHSSDWVNTNNSISIMDFSSAKSSIQLYQECIKQIQSQLAKDDSIVIRLLFVNAPVKLMAITLPLLLTHIRTHSLPVVILLTIRPWYITSNPSSNNNLSSLVSLRRTCDAVFTCEGFAAMTTPVPPEFSDLAGIFTIHKMALQSLHHFADSSMKKRPPANRYGMKRDRRKVHLRMLHLPPEDFSAGGSSVGSGVRSGAGKVQSKDGGGGSNSNSNTRTALEPGLGCASHRKPATVGGASSSSSLDF